MKKKELLQGQLISFLFFWFDRKLNLIEITRTH
jgi:hypothetical protein